MNIGDRQVEDYRRDGAVVSRGAFIDWVEPLSRGVESNMASPGVYGSENVRPGDGSGQANGERLREDWFPTVWRAAS